MSVTFRLTSEVMLVAVRNDGAERLAREIGIHCHNRISRRVDRIQHLAQVLQRQ